MLKRSAALAALLALAGCDDRDHDLLITNTGTQPVIVEVASDDSWNRNDHDIFEVPAGATFREDYDSGNVEVFIFRKSDGLILFAADFDREDFEDDHGTIEITVTP